MGIYDHIILINRISLCFPLFSMYFFRGARGARCPSLKLTTVAASALATAKHPEVEPLSPGHLWSFDGGWYQVEWPWPKGTGRHWQSLGSLTHLTHLSHLSHAYFKDLWMWLHVIARDRVTRAASVLAFLWWMQVVSWNLVPWIVSGQHKPQMGIFCFPKLDLEKVEESSYSKISDTEIVKNRQRCLTEIDRMSDSLIYVC